MIIRSLAVCLLLVLCAPAARAEDEAVAQETPVSAAPEIPLDQPILDTPALMSWVATAAADTFTFTYLDHEKRMQENSKYYTKAGWENFTTALEKSHILDSVQANQQTVTAQPRSAPMLIQHGVLNGRYRWILTMPLMVKYQSAKEIRTDQMQLQLVVDRVPLLENPSGLGIAQWIARAR